MRAGKEKTVLTKIIKESHGNRCSLLEPRCGLQVKQNLVCSFAALIVGLDAQCKAFDSLTSRLLA